MLDSASPLVIAQLSIDELKNYRFNPREHPPKQITMLVKSIKRFGFNNPVLIAPDNELIAGHGRVEAARRCGITHVPTITLPHLNPAERRAYRIADNNIALKGSWNFDLLRKEVEFLLDDGFEVDVDELGFEMAEFDFLLGDEDKAADEPAPVSNPRRDLPATSKIGDIWTIAGHRIICGDSRLKSTYEALLGDELVAAVVTDMPWNRRVNGHIGGRGKVQHPEFAMASGEMSLPQFREFMHDVLAQQAAFCRNGAISLQFIDWRGVADMIAIGENAFTGGLINICVWAKQVPGMGSLWRSQHELCCAFKVGSGKHINNVMLGKYGRNRSNLWQYDAPLGFSKDRKNLELHPTSKNVEMLADAIMDITNRGDLVLDAFLGSGATALGAHQTGRIGRAIEIDPYFVDVSLERLIDLTGEDAIDNDGVLFSARRAAVKESEG